MRALCNASVLAGLLAGGADAQAPAGVVTYTGAVSHVTLALPTLRDVAEEGRRLSELVAACRRVIMINPSDSAALLTRELPPLATDGLPAQDVVELTVTPKPSVAVNCGNRTRSAGLIEARAQWIAFDSLVAPDRIIARVQLSNGARPVTPLATERVALRRLGPIGYEGFEGFAVRMAIRISDLAPDSTGTAPRLIIEVASAENSTPDRIVIEWPVLREVWDQTLVARAEALGPQPPSLDFPLPRDSTLQAAHRAYRSGDAETAARLANARLQRGDLPPDDETWARAFSAAVFGTAEDTLATRVSVEQLAAIQPCLRWSDAAPALVRSLSSRLPPSSRRCETRGAAAMLTRSLLLPGFARVPESRGERVSQFAVAGAIVGTALYSQRLRRETRETYDRYLAAQYEPIGSGTPQANVTALFADAEQTQRMGKYMVFTAIAVYVAQAGYNVWSEHRMRRRINRYQSYGEPTVPRVGIRAESQAARVGLGLEWTW